jgi:hypothetical protein
MLVVTVNDRPLEVAAIVQRGRVLVPMRAVFAALGADVRYDARNRVVVARTRAHDVVVQLGDRTPIVDGRTYVPLRFVAQALGASVAYDGKAQIVSVRTPNLAATPEPVAPAQAPLPEMPPEPAYDYQFYVSGARAFYPGDWMHFTLVAPPGGTAELQLCGIGMRYPMSNGGYGDRYVADIPAPYGYWLPGCAVTALYTTWTGRQIAVPLPVIVDLFTIEPPHDRHHPTPSPSPAATPAHRAVPPGPRRPEPTPAPTAAPTPAATHAPQAVRTAHPIVQPRPRQTPKG